MPLVSIVMPAYNVEKYIEAAIESIKAQTYTDWELIICDDCSTDNTIKIIEKHQKDNKQIKLIKMSNNSGGCRLPRFEAILAAKGVFVCPIDSDDTIETAYLEKLISKQKETNANIVLSKMVLCNEDLSPKGCTIPNSAYNIEKTQSGKDAVRETIGGWKISMNGLMCKTSIYKKFISENYKSDYNGAFADEIDHRKLLLCASTISITDASYHYRQQPNSIVHSVSANSYRLLIANLKLLEFVENIFNDEKDILQRMYDEYLEKIYRVQQKFYLNYESYNKKERKEINKLIRSSYNIIKERKLTFSNKRNKFLSITFCTFKLYSWIIYKIITLRR